MTNTDALIKNLNHILATYRESLKAKETNSVQQNQE
jgi:hypothetical protein